MADATFDAVVIGGGCKGLVTAIYLAKYGGMSVGVFEERHELGGGLASSEALAPGFVADTHVTAVFPFYFAPVEQDFPDFVEKGGKLGHQKGSLGVITRENVDKCCVFYHVHEDPTQEKTAGEIARFAGEKDAERYLKIWDYAMKTNYFDIVAQTSFNLPNPLDEPSAMERWFRDFLKQPDCPISDEWLILPPIVAAQELFDNFGLVAMGLRWGIASGVPAVVPGGGIGFLLWGILGMPVTSLVVGGTHNVAHAYMRILVENGGKYFTQSHVKRIIIENGRARGIRLGDGTEVEARKMVVSSLNPHQLCFELLGGEHLSQRILKKVENLESGGTGCIMFYHWALREGVNFKAADFNPDINNTQSILLGSEDPEIWYDEFYLKRMGKVPSCESKLLHHTPGDKRRMPENRHICMTEHATLRCDQLTEREWLQLKRTHAEEVIREWQVYTTNMPGDNIIGCDPQTPYDNQHRLSNMSPWGKASRYKEININRPPSMTPISEFSRYRIADIKSLYGTGMFWVGSGSQVGSSMADAGYLAYKVIAEDFGLSKPWEEKGRAW